MSRPTPSAEAAIKEADDSERGLKKKRTPSLLAPVEKKDESDKDDTSTSEEDEFDTEVPDEEVLASAFLDEIVQRLMTAKSQVESPPAPVVGHKPASSPRKTIEPAPIIPVHLTADEIVKLCDMAIQSFSKQKALIRFEKKDLPLIIAGDLHGQFRDLRSIMSRCGPPMIQSYLFLGDYVDRGVQGIEVITLLLALKCKYPTKVFMLRGNHEDGNTCMSYGFYDECMERFIIEDGLGERVWRKFLSVFNWLPVAAIIDQHGLRTENPKSPVIDQHILAMHGGISPCLNSLEDIEKLPRPSIVPPYGLMCDLVWSDPDDRNDGWSLSPRGISLTFSSSVVEELCTKLGVDLVVRAHQLTSEMIRSGYKFFADGRLITIFSAPNYLNMRNDACVMKVSKKLHCRFIVFRTMRKPVRTRSLAQRHPRKSVS